MQFSYGPDRQRWKQIYTSPTPTETTYYVGGLLEVVFVNNTTTYRHYIYAGAEPIAVYSRTAAGVNTMSYMLEDHQGGVSTIASKAGAADVNESFSAFGTRRNPTTWSGAPSTADLNTIAGLSRQGYTFQTALGQSMGLNHMNGRVQDAILGRFLSPDPHIPDRTNAQSYNRYSYANNNPATLVDPTGFFTACPIKNHCFYNGDQNPNTARVRVAPRRCVPSECSRGLYSRAWANGAGRAFKISSLTKFFGIGGLAAGTALDAQSLQDGEITGVQFGVNLGLGVLGVFIPAYAIGSLNAQFMNNFYPGGWQGYYEDVFLDPNNPLVITGGYDGSR